MVRTISVQCTAVPLLCVMLASLCGAAQPLFAPTRGQGTTPGLHQGTVRLLTVPPQMEMSKEKSDHIRQLIADLALVDKQDLGFSDTYIGWQFSPLKGTEPVGVMRLVDPIQHPSQPMEALVRSGPTALPYLLEALTDKTPTKLTLQCPPVEEAIMRMVRELPLNPLNQREQQEATDIGAAFKDGPYLSHYTVTIGDLCMVAIGQIVGRPYQAAYRKRELTILINSPCHDPELATKLRAIWSSKEPAQHLLNSLLLDYATEGVSNGVLLDDFWQASRFQIEAARRLLFYFPDQAVPMIANRLRSLKFDFPAGSPSFKIVNGVDVVDFLRAVAWCKDRRIQQELTEIAWRTKDPDVITACHDNENKLLPEPPNNMDSGPHDVRRP